MKLPTVWSEKTAVPSLIIPASPPSIHAPSSAHSGRSTRKGFELCYECFHHTKTTTACGGQPQPFGTGQACCGRQVVQVSRKCWCCAKIYRKPPWSSPWYMVPKLVGALVVITPYERPDCKRFLAIALYNLHDFAALLHSEKIFSKIDFVKRYHQVPTILPWILFRFCN